MKTLEILLKMPEKKLFTFLISHLSKHYPSVSSKEGYIYAQGTLPILLVAHLDTIFKEPRYIELFYDKRKDSLVCPGGAGFDDRAGVYAIILLLKKGFRPSILFTLGEERGGIGASQFLHDYPTAPTPTKFIIELDRQGIDDCVFYNCGNQSFASYINSFGFQTQLGTFTDISVFSESWDTASVNLSIGYEDEHTAYERLHVKAFHSIVEKVAKILKDVDNAPSYDYQVAARAEYGFDICGKCNSYTSYFETYPVLRSNSHPVPYCMDCLASVKWCRTCGSAYDAPTCPKCGDGGKAS